MSAGSTTIQNHCKECTACDTAFKKIQSKKTVNVINRMVEILEHNKIFKTTQELIDYSGLKFGECLDTVIVSVVAEEKLLQLRKEGLKMINAMKNAATELSDENYSTCEVIARHIVQ
jgi:hypothetical protein